MNLKREWNIFYAIYINLINVNILISNKQKPVNINERHTKKNNQEEDLNKREQVHNTK